MELGLGDRVAIVTGASRGIGRGIVETLLAEGAKVVAGAGEVDALSGLGCVAVPVDLSTANGPATLIATATEAFSGSTFSSTTSATRAFTPAGSDR